MGVCVHKALGQMLNQPGPLPVNYSMVEKELRTGEPSRPSWWAGVVLKILGPGGKWTQVLVLVCPHSVAIGK